MKKSNEYDTRLWISCLIRHKPQTKLTVALLVLVGMMFLVPAITDKALGATYHKVLDYGRYMVGCCEEHNGKGEWQGEWEDHPTVTIPYNYIQWKTVGSAFVGNEKGYITAFIKVNGQPARANFGWWNPTSGTNSCVVNIDPLVNTDPPIKGIKPSCFIEQGMVPQAVYCINGTPLDAGGSPVDYYGCKVDYSNKPLKSKSK